MENLSDYEAVRQQRVLENRELLRSLGLDNFTVDVKPVKRKPPTKKERDPNAEYAPIRRSNRHQDKEIIFNGLDSSSDEDDYVENTTAQRRKSSGKKSYGRRSNPGRRIQGGRIYDSEHGTTCHQCRQKTMEEKVKCTNILPRGQGLCGLMLDERCLIGRYGQSLEDARQTGEWVCPKCQGNCNCSFCRRKSGLVPTGPLVYIAREKGYAGVSEYLEAVGQHRWRKRPIDEADKENQPRRGRLSGKKNARKEKDAPPDTPKVLPKKVLPKRAAKEKAREKKEEAYTREIEERIAAAKELFLGVFI